MRVPWPLMRGHVYLVPLDADDPAKAGQTIPKFAVVLQGQPGFSRKLRVSVVIATSNLTGAGKSWNVLVKGGTTQFWPQDTLICCADVYSLLVSEVQGPRATHVGSLTDAVMAEVGIALAISLEL